MFIGRERELASLKEFYDKDGIGMTVIYGRRRIGKSTLIAEFVKDKKTIFYTATKVGKTRNLELFSRQVVELFMPGMENISFGTLEAVFDFIDKNIGDEKIVLVIDELPYWAEKDEALLSVLQKYIDTVWNDKNLKIILCGSALSFMEKKVLSEKSPLFGRRNSQIKLEAFNYLDAAKFVPNYSNEDKAICYGITGGVAKYLSMIDSNKSIDENIVRLFFRTDGYLYDETRNLLTQEFSDISLVNNIVEQIASGENALNIIAAKIGEKAQTVLYSLEKLRNVGLIEKKKCITDEKNKKKTQYVLKDYMFKFWYEFIPKATSVIEMGQGEIYYTKVVKPVLHSFMGSIFEEMCRYYTLMKGITGEYGCFITSVGTWWGVENITEKDGEVRAQSADIDVVALSEVDKKAVVGECKFNNEKIDKGIYDTLIRRSKLISAKYKVSKYIFFSLSGYTDWYDSLADEDVLLLTLDSLYE
ncbi:ATP-binding protein [Clostridium sp. OM05-6BH]|uniref:ATP-binding protein n=1 Tax=unclassified Clostridium TaxID=2614128 RepID=UPI000E4C5B44|nr:MULTISPECIES: ATP-binding protein [unclassified Clostridium]RHV15817.1 ATP-binding protein [Clostridium sp. OM05-9BH]RHV20233.1 ATP-binding protein [Clostridium sp. OM05-6BH]